MPSQDKQKQKFGQFAQKVEQSLGIIPGTKIWTPFPFAGLNLQDSAPAIDDKEFSYLENFFRLGNGYLRTAWDVANPLYVPPGGKFLLSYFFWYNIGETDYVILFFTDGTALQVKQSDRSITTVSAVGGTFFIPNGNLPICSQSGSQYLLIANNNTKNDYWIWDGSILYGAGTLSPFVNLLSSGANYNSAPTITAFGGSGSGATFSASINGGAVTNVAVTNPGSGYGNNDVVQLHFSGGGSDTSPELQAVLTPAGVGAIAVLIPGAHYTSAPAVNFSGGGGGTGAAATATISNGQVVSIAVTAAGSGYTSAPIISLTGGGGTGAAAQALLSPTTVASITVIDGGTGFTGTPLLSITGGGGSGATATATVGGGAIVSAAVTLGGTGYTDAPAVLVAPGSNHSAYATVQLMPFGVSGSALETFNSRVWLANPAPMPNIQTGGDFIVSSAGSLTDFATSDGGVLFTNSDRFLRKHYVGIRQSNGYLYFFGDSSVSVVSNIQSTGSPPSTTFNYQNVDPQIGMAWRDTVQDFGRTILFANQTGVYGLFGGAATKISSKLDQLFDNAIFPPAARAITPSASVGTIFNVKHYFISFTVQDPETGAVRDILAGWNEKEWGLYSQTQDIVFTNTQEVNSNLTAWGVNTTGLYALFQQPNSALTKRLSTKSYGTDQVFILKDFLNLYVQAQDMSGGSGVNMAVTMVASGIAIQPDENNIDQDSVASITLTSATFAETLYQQPQFPAPPPYWPVFGTGTGGFSCATLLARFTTNSPDFAIANLMLVYQDSTAYQ